jgi:DNA-binding transcriptional MerR regulator
MGTVAQSEARYTTEDVIRLTGVSAPALKFIIRKGFSPKWKSQGNRQRSYYSDEDLEFVRNYVRTKPRKRVHEEQIRARQVAWGMWE